MANTALLRSLLSSSSSTPTKLIPKFPLKSTPNLTTRPFTSSEANPISPKLHTLVTFTPPNSSDPQPEPTQKNPFHSPRLYDPFFNKPINIESKDPKTLLEEFQKVRSQGLVNNAVKVFDEMSKDGLRLTHEALDMFKEIRVKGRLPDVVTHIAVIEAYANAGIHNEAHHKMYLKMLAPGVIPNAYTYSVLIKSLAFGDDWKMHGEAMKCVLEMLGKGMKPDASACVAVFEAFARKKRVEEGRELLEEMKRRGFVLDGKGVVGVLKRKREPLVRTLMEILFAKC